MPTLGDIGLVEVFVGDVVRTATLVTQDRAPVSFPDRGPLRGAVAELAEVQGPRIVGGYAAAEDEELSDAGLSGEHLRAKIEIASSGSTGVESEAHGPDGIRAPAVRAWTRRAIVLAASLATVVPAAEALVGLIDLVDAAVEG